MESACSLISAEIFTAVMMDTPFALMITLWKMPLVIDGTAM
jgi:hypothetical protein